MFCNKCGNKLLENAKFCGKCGKSVLIQDSPEPSVENKKAPSGVGMMKRILKIILIIFFVAGVSQISSKQSSIDNSWIGDIYNVLTIVSVVTFFILLSKWWKNRKTNKKWFNWRWITLLIVLSFLNFSALVFSQAITVAREKVAQQANSTTYSPEYISELVKEMKTQMSLPKKINESLTATDITSELNTIRYYYLFSPADTDSITSESLKSNLIQDVCNSESAKNLFDKGVNIEYVYNIQNTVKSYLVSFSKADCL